MAEEILNVKNAEEFREWMDENSESKKECYVALKRGRPTDTDHFWYLDAIEVVLCYGWIDSTLRYVDGYMIQRFSPRVKNCNWTELNKERARRLIKLGLMREPGLKSLPPMGPRSFKANPEIVNELKKHKVWSKFKKFPELYQRIRLSNLEFYLNKLDKDAYQKMLNHVIETTKKGEMFGEWNDYGRLLNY